MKNADKEKILVSDKPIDRMKARGQFYKT